MSDPKSKDDAIRMIKQGLDLVYYGIAFNCSVPVFWYPKNQPRRPKVINSGTAFFVDAGKGPFAITARHVMEGLRRDRAQQHLISHVGPLSIDLLERLIAEDDQSDVVTFSVSEQEISRMGKMAHTPLHGWPPNPPNEGKGVFFGGYRAIDREESPENIIWGFAGALTIARNIRDNRMTVQFEREHFVQKDNLPCPAPGERWGGVSGGPVFAVVTGAVDTWRIAGVISEYNENLEVFYMYGLATIMPDGRIRAPQ